MQTSSVTLLLLVFSCSYLWKVQGVGVDLGICSSGVEKCVCGGAEGYPIFIPVKQCTFFYRWKPYCKACDEIKQEVRCAPYVTCKDCEAQIDRCTRCPPGRYGKWCTSFCTCQNGGSCDQDTGYCICPPQFQGVHCDKTAFCKPLPMPSGVIFEPLMTNYPVGITVTFSCKTGEVLEGSHTALCSEQAEWTARPPQCIRECPLLTMPTHGTIELSGGRFREGTTATYSCQGNYRIVGDSVRVCLGNGQWNGKEPVCEEIITCPKPEQVELGQVLVHPPGPKDDLTPGTTAKYSCTDGFVLVGPSEILCRSDGNWSAEAPICAHKENVCFHPGPLENGVIRPHDKKHLKTFLQGTILEFFCDPLHYLVGNSSSVCGPNGTWSIPKPSCHKLTTCTSVETLANGRLNIYTPDSQLIENARRARMDTPTSMRYQPTLKREEEELAKYNTKLPEGHYHVGTRIVFACESRYYDLVGSRMRTCMTNGEWSGRQPTCIPVCGRSSGPRLPFITHGTVSEMGQWPWQVGIARRLLQDDPLGEWWLMCGGALVSERWVVTAAHCVTYKYSTEAVPAEEFRLYFGKYHRNDSKDDDLVQVRQVESIHIHKDYEPTTFESDIALVQTSEPLQFTSRVQAVCLPEEDPHDSKHRLKEGNIGVITGWGRTETGNYSEVLQDAQVPVVNSEQCEEDYRESGVPLIVTNNMFCAGHNEGLYDSCGGDSGGPLVFPVDERRDRWVLEGIVSWGSPYGCGNPRQHGGYVRVQKFVDWILQFI